MSIKLMERVWAHSRAKGGELLVMLALADFANKETGESWPSIETLAEKARLTDRQTQRILNELEKAGEISRVRSNGGRNRRNRYVITVNENPDKITLKKLHRKNNGVIDDTKTLTPMSPALNRHRTVNKDVSQKRSRTSAPDPRVKQVADYWCPKFSTVFGDKYPWSQKDGQIAKDLLRLYRLERLIEFIDLFFESKDEFVCNKAGFTVGVFKTRIPALISTNRAPKNERPTMPEFGS
jgi:predicted transcriptional regulator